MEPHPIMQSEGLEIGGRVPALSFAHHPPVFLTPRGGPYFKAIAISTQYRHD
jgi:hypothetical protein